jgi:hypothetical protein
MTSTPPALPPDLWPHFWDESRAPETGADFATWAALVVGMSTRNAVEDLHAAGAFSDQQAPAFNRRIRNRAYEVLLALQALAETGYDDRLVEFLDDHAMRDGETGETIEPLAAMRGAIRAAVRDFAKAEGVPQRTADKLEAAALDGATDAFKALRSLDEDESMNAVIYWGTGIPSYWEMPEVAPELRELFDLVSDE